MIERIQYDEMPGAPDLDPTVDEVVGDGEYHLEMMHDGCLWLRFEEDTFTVTIRRRWFRRPVLEFVHHGKTHPSASPYIEVPDPEDAE